MELFWDYIPHFGKFFKNTSLTGDNSVGEARWQGKSKACTLMEALWTIPNRDLQILIKIHITLRRTKKKKKSKSCRTTFEVPPGISLAVTHADLIPTSL